MNLPSSERSLVDASSLFTICFLALVVFLGGCGTHSSRPEPYRGGSRLHGITAIPKWDSPGTVILDFKYLANGKQIGGISRQTAEAPGFGGWGSIGESRYTVGDAVYAKWKLVETGEVFEQTVNLSNLLPAPVEEMGGFYFVFDKATLHIYLASAWKKGLVPCSIRHAQRRDNLTPDSAAAAYNCGSLLWKLYPEQKQLNYPQ